MKAPITVDIDESTLANAPIGECRSRRPLLLRCASLRCWTCRHVPSVSVGRHRLGGWCPPTIFCILSYAGPWVRTCRRPRRTTS